MLSESISIIIPCFNEEDGAPHLFKILNPVLVDLQKSFYVEVIFVDDGSADNTYSLLMEYSQGKDNIKLHKHSKNMGMGAAIKTGIDNSNCMYIVTLDSDCTFHPNQISKLIDAAKNHNVDFVVGSPYLYGYDKDIPAYRVILSQICNLLYKLVLGEKITAMSPIFKLYKNNDLKELSFESNGFSINAEIMAKLIIKEKEFIEIPTELKVRTYGDSKINNSQEILNHLRMINNIRKWRAMANK